MRIREIIFQGIFGCDSPVRLATAPGVDRMVLPRGLSAENVQSLLIAALFPQNTPNALVQEMREADDVKLAVIFEVRDQIYRVVRRDTPDSLRLQVQERTGFRPLASGQESVAEQLRDSVGLPEFECFVALNLWRFDGDLLGGPRAAPEAAQRGQVMVEKYRLALQAESLEDQIKVVEADLATQRAALGQGSQIEEKLEQARARLAELQLTGLSEEELSLLRDKDARLVEFDQLIYRLTTQQEEAQHDVAQNSPAKPWRVPLFWVGLLAGVGALVVSVAVGGALRPVAASNVLTFGIVAWMLLKYYTDMERAGVHQARLESIRRRVSQVRDEEASFREAISHMLIHARVEDEAQLFERVEKAQQLEEIVARMEERVAEVRRNPAHRQAKGRIDALQAQLAELRGAREALPAHIMSSYEAEEDLRTLGLDPRRVLLEEHARAEAPPAPTTPFGWLRLAAERTQQWQQGQLDPRVRKMWGKICGHVLSDAFKNVDLSPQGDLQIAEMTSDQLDMWRRTRASEVRIVGVALALALHVNAPQRDRQFMETVWLRDPRDEFGLKIADALDDVFSSAARKSHIVLCG